MTDAERLIEQERCIATLRVKNAKLETRVARLQAMHDNAQRHIGRLQKIIDQNKTNLAEEVFGEK